jgi:hypothetical protein
MSFVVTVKRVTIYLENQCIVDELHAIGISV